MKCSAIQITFSSSKGNSWVEWGFYALSASKAIFRARTYNCNLFSPVMMITWWMKLGGNRPPGDNPLLFFDKTKKKKNGTNFDIFYLGKYALGIHLSLVRNLHECCHCKKSVSDRFGFQGRSEATFKICSIYLENLSKGPFIIINVLKFRFFFIEIVPTPNFDFKILMPFPSQLPILNILCCLLSSKCTATLLKDRFNGE